MGFYMATIRKIKRAHGIVYKAIIKDRQGKAITSKTFTRKTDAATWAKRIEADTEAVQALGSKGGRMTFKQLADEYMSQWLGKDLNQVNRVQYWVNDIGLYRLPDITGDLIRQRLKLFEQGGCIRGNGGLGNSLTMNRTRKPGTVNRHRTALSGIFRYAVQRGYLTVNPVSKTTCLKDDAKIVRFLSYSERNSLLEACRQSEWNKLYLLVLMAMTTGMRKGELLKLRW